MSAVAVGIWDEGCIIAADGLCSDIDGTVKGFASKIITWPSRNAAIAWCGIGTFGHFVSLAVAQSHPTFDNLVEDFPDICERVHDDIVRNDQRAWFQDDFAKAMIVLVGYSDARQKFEAYRMVSYAKESLNSATGESKLLEPWTLLPIEYVFCSHAPPVQVINDFGINDEENIGDMCVRYICANRQDSGAIDGDIDGAGGRHYNVGGYVQMAYLQRGLQQSWIAHRWPEDVVGAPVDPTKGQKLPDYLMEKDAAKTAQQPA